MLENNAYTLWTIPAESSDEQNALKRFVEDMEERGLSVAEATPDGIGWWKSNYKGDLVIVNLDEMSAKISTGEVVVEEILKVTLYRSEDSKLPSIFSSAVYIAEKNII